MTLFERYINGEHEAVWRDLCAAGLKVRAEPLYTDAAAVARETMRRAHHNIDLLYNRLVAAGYQFDCAESHRLVPPPPDIGDRLGDFEKRIGLLPLSVRAWCEHAGSVNFSGAHPGLTGKAPGFSHTPRDAIMLWRDESPPHSRPTPPVLVGDPLVFHFDINADKAVLALKTARFSGDVLDWRFEDRHDFRGPYRSSDLGTTYGLTVGPDAGHKARLGGFLCSIQLPDGGADTRLSLDSGVMFVEYLRVSFAWGGFPGLARAPGHNAELVAFLKADLLPI